jgi:hypothetical protein
MNEGCGDIPMPKPGDKLEGGHAVVAVGYDDGKKIGKDKGALLIRNSWGTAWGEKRYGWLPYAYDLKRSVSTNFASTSDQKSTARPSSARHPCILCNYTAVRLIGEQFQLVSKGLDLECIVEALKEA